MNKRWIPVGEILVEPDGSNLYPKALYAVVNRTEAVDAQGRILHRVSYEDFVVKEERYEVEGTPYLRSVEVPICKTVITDNSRVSRWLLLSDEVLLERYPRGSTYIDVLAGSEEDPDIDGDEYLQFAAQMALGRVCESIFGQFRPVVDKHGNLMVNPAPVLVGKTA